MTKLVAAMLPIFLPYQLALAEDSGLLTLGSEIGATDYYKVTCPDPSTDRLRFNIIDNSLENASEIPPQKINAHISKNGVGVGNLTAQSNSSSEEIILNNGDGKYQITIDTIGTNDVLQTQQTYTFTYQCFNSNGQPTKASGFKVGSSKKIKNYKKAKATITCKQNKSIEPKETAYLKLTLINTSALPIQEWVSSLPVLTAQVAKKDVNRISNTTDLAGDTAYGNTVDLPGGAGDYFISVNNTGTSNSAYNAKDYAFVYSCLGSDNAQKPATFSIIQDQ